MTGLGIRTFRARPVTLSLARDRCQGAKECYESNKTLGTANAIYVAACRRGEPGDELAIAPGQLLFAVFFRALESAALGQQGHGVHQVLHGDDADQSSAIYHWNHTQSARAQLAEGLHQRVSSLRDLETPHHCGLHVTVAPATQRVHDPGLINDAYHLHPPHHWK